MSILIRLIAALFMAMVAIGAPLAAEVATKSTGADGADNAAPQGAREKTAVLSATRNLHGNYSGAFIQYMDTPFTIAKGKIRCATAGCRVEAIMTVGILNTVDANRTWVCLLVDTNYADLGCPQLARLYTSDDDVTLTTTNVMTSLAKGTHKFEMFLLTHYGSKPAAYNMTVNAYSNR